MGAAGAVEAVCAIAEKEERKNALRRVFNVVMVDLSVSMSSGKTESNDDFVRL
jgi:hypothetical protein